MKVSDLDGWNIEAFEGCEIFCPDCETWSSITKWKYTDRYCDTCGRHDYLECHICRDGIDQFPSVKIETRKPVN